jgi:hypothetical protein
MLHTLVSIVTQNSTTDCMIVLSLMLKNDKSANFIFACGNNESV